MKGKSAKLVALGIVLVLLASGIGTARHFQIQAVAIGNTTRR